MNENDLINDFIYFEYQLKILLSLNSRFSFETDIYFSDAAKLKEVFIKYPKLFISFESFLKIHLTIRDLEENVSSNINCLYLTLKKLKLINGKKIDFINYLLDEHNIIQKNLLNLDLKYLPKDQERVDGFIRIFHEFEAKNE
jgi:hypothetical protein